MKASTLVQLSEVSAKEIARIGNIRIIEAEYELENAIKESSDTLWLEQDNYYVLDSEVFIPIREASKKSGLSQKLLSALCEKEILYGKYIEKNWYISNAALAKLLSLIWSTHK